MFCDIFFKVSSENNGGIIERVIAQALHEDGGRERCPWTRVIMEGTCTLPFTNMEEITVRAIQYICNIGFSAVTELFKDNELFKRGQVRVNKT